MTSLAALVTPLTVDEAKAAIYTAMANRGVSTTSWKPGAVVRTIIAACAIIYAAFSSMQAAIANGGFLDLATGPWLTLLARYVYNVDRSPEGFATGFITLTNSGGGVWAGDPGDLIVSNPDTGKTYRNTEAYSLGASTSIVVAIQAEEAGSASSSAPDSITNMVTTLLEVTCNNADALVGSDEETNAALRQRCREKTGAASPNGPRDAYAYFAKSAIRTDGVKVAVTRVRTIPDGFGSVNVYVATASGSVTGDVDDASTDLGAVNKAIQENVVPIGITAIVQSATPVEIDVEYELWVLDSINASNDEIMELNSNSLAKFFGEMDIGGEVIAGVFPADAGGVFVDSIKAIIAQGLGFGSVVRLVVTEPADDTELAANEAPVLSSVTVTSVHRVLRTS